MSVRRGRPDLMRTQVEEEGGPPDVLPAHRPSASDSCPSCGAIPEEKCDFCPGCGTPLASVIVEGAEPSAPAALPAPAPLQVEVTLRVPSAIPPQPPQPERPEAPPPAQPARGKGPGDRTMEGWRNDIAKGEGEGLRLLVFAVVMVVALGLLYVFVLR